MEAAFICTDDLWAGGFGHTHPLKPERLKRTYELLTAYRAFDAPHSHLVAPDPVSREDLLLFHTAEYVDAVARLSRGEKNMPALCYGFRPDETPAFPGMYEIEGLKVGAALTGARLITEGQVQAAFSFGGGMHHARAALASGFCVFNDVAVAIHWLLRQGLRVAYVDIDVHHGDGVQAAFYDTDRVLTISLHQAGILFYPGTGFPEELGTGAGYGYSINLPFLIYTSEELYLRAFRQVVPPLVRQFAPDVLVTQLGVDTHYRDSLGSLLLTTRGYIALVEELKMLAEGSRRWLAFGGGGYAADVVPRAWTLAYGVMSGQTFPDELPPAYSERHGPGRLHDTAGPEPVEAGVVEKTREYVEKNLDTLRARTRDVWRWE
ncbi:MAG: acetoin utilization protein AcuC [Anaerolineae bacterium]|nr:acetoin utilization protein AcuC [Anaerolineae bacterium]